MIRFVLLAILAVPMVVATSLNAQSIVELELELEALSQEIIDARSSAESHESEIVRETAAIRLETLRLSGALLQSRIYAIEGKDAVQVDVVQSQPDHDAVREILNEMELAGQRLAEFETEHASAIGDQRMIAESRLEDEKLALARLRVALISARYGIVLPGMLRKESEPSNSWLTSERPRWADASYPEIDYSREIFRDSFDAGARLSGWWAIYDEEGRGEFSAENFSAAETYSGGSDHGAVLRLSCSNGRMTASIRLLGDSFDGYGNGTGNMRVDLTYRIDQMPDVDGGLEISTSGKSASDSDVFAARMVLNMQGSNLMEARYRTEDSGRVRTVFDLSGFDSVAEAIGDQCNQPEIVLNRQDYRLVQALLAIAGFNPGAADGIWGPQSETAMRKYQQSAGMTATGVPDLPTLQLLGLVRH